MLANELGTEGAGGAQMAKLTGDVLLSDQKVGQFMQKYAKSEAAANFGADRSDTCQRLKPPTDSP